MTISETYQDIVNATLAVQKSGLSIAEKWPERQGNTVSWRERSDISIALKNVPYIDKYNDLNDHRNYNFKMLDGALLQFMYEFNNSGRQILSHRLAFFPSPMLERFDNIPQDYEEVYFGNSEFHDVLEKNIIAFPIRFDFNASTKFFKEIDHPYSHVTFGEYEYCRIPVRGPLTPSIFLNFILRNFYNYAVRKDENLLSSSVARYEATITAAEQSILHFNIV